MLEVGPALPGAASESEHSLEPRDAPFDAGPEASQLPVDPTGAHHLRDLQSAFLGKGDILDALLFGPLQIGAAGKASVTTDLSRPTAVQIILAPHPGLELTGIVRVPPHHLSIQHQAGDAAGQKQLVPKDRFPALLFDDVGVLLKQGEDFLGGRNRLSPQHPPLGLVDDLLRQIQVMAQLTGDDQTGQVGEPIRLPQRPLGVMSGLASDLQQIPIGSQTTLAPVVGDVRNSAAWPGAGDPKRRSCEVGPSGAASG